MMLRFNWFRPSQVAGVLALSMAVVFPSFAYDPTGKWQVTSGESRYRVLFCERDKLCAKLIWLRDDVTDQEVRAYLNQYVVTGAVEVRPNLWSGGLKYGGDVYQGELTVNDDRHMTLEGCKGILCQSFSLDRLNTAAR